MSGDVGVMPGDVRTVSLIVRSIGVEGEVLLVCLEDTGGGAGIGGA